MLLTRRRVQLLLGVLWLLDAALQYQPYMFSRAFATHVLAPSAAGNPGWVADPVHWAARLTASHPVLLNAAFATVQLLIAIGLFYRRTVKVALLISIGWSLGIWWLGEGVGGLLTGAVSPLAGYPGAVILYALIAILAWPRYADIGLSIADASPLRRSAAVSLWAVLWLAAAAETIWPSARHTVANGIRDMADGQPGWLAGINRSVGDAAHGHSVEISIAFTVAFVVIAAAPLFPATAARATLGAAVLLSLAIWVIAQDLGGILTGSGTDPNSAPVLALLAVCYWPRRNMHLPAAYPVARGARVASRAPQPT